MSIGVRRSRRCLVETYSSPAKVFSKNFVGSYCSWKYRNTKRHEVIKTVTHTNKSKRKAESLQAIPALPEFGCTLVNFMKYTILLFSPKLKRQAFLQMKPFVGEIVRTSPSGSLPICQAVRNIIQSCCRCISVEYRPI